MENLIRKLSAYTLFPVALAVSALSPSGTSARSTERDGDKQKNFPQLEEILGQNERFYLEKLPEKEKAENEAKLKNFFRERYETEVFDMSIDRIRSNEDTSKNIYFVDILADNGSENLPLGLFMESGNEIYIVWSQIKRALNRSVKILSKKDAESDSEVLMRREYENFVGKIYDEKTLDDFSRHFIGTFNSQEGILRRVLEEEELHRVLKERGIKGEESEELAFLQGIIRKNSRPFEDLARAYAFAESSEEKRPKYSFFNKIKAYFEKNMKPGENQKNISRDRVREIARSYGQAYHPDYYK